jgi:hypothetical protein
MLSRSKRSQAEYTCRAADRLSEKGREITLECDIHMYSVTVNREGRLCGNILQSSDRHTEIFK